MNEKDYIEEFEILTDNLVDKYGVDRDSSEDSDGSVSIMQSPSVNDNSELNIPNHLNGPKISNYGNNKSNGSNSSLNDNKQKKVDNSQNNVGETIDEAGSQVLQKMGVPKPLSDKAIKKNGGTFSPTNQPGSKMISNNIRKNAGNGVGGNIGNKVLSAVNPALGALSKTKAGSSFLNKALSKKGNSPLDLLSSKNNKEDKNKDIEDDSLNNKSTTNSKGSASYNLFGNISNKRIFIGMGVLVFLIPFVLVLFLIPSISMIKPSIIDVSTGSINESRTSDLFDNSINTDVDINVDATPSAYLDIYDDKDLYNSLNVVLVANTSGMDVNKLNEIYNFKCNNEDTCNDVILQRFYNKIYDVYYLYLTKYKVKLDIPLLMSTIIFKTDNVDFRSYLDDYDRQLIVESDWNPTGTTTLDWDYDYENQENYLMANDYSMDIQILAKNMVRRYRSEFCTKSGKIKMVRDDEPDLECDLGDNLNYGDSRYELDIDKYKEFLVQYIDRKYYDKYFVFSPTITEGPSYTTDKVPSVVKGRRKSSSTSTSSTTTTVTDSDVINKLNSIALGEVGNGGTKYRMYLWKEDNGLDWCAAFISWLYSQVGGIDKYIVADGGAGGIPRETIKTLGGMWLEDECYDSSTVPQVGDIILFDPWIGNGTLPWPDNGNDKYYSSHIGYVYKVDKDNVYTVEGNSNDMVQAKQYSRKHCGNGSRQGINGYFRPNYGIKSTSTSSSKNNPVGVSKANSNGSFSDKIFYYNQYDYNGYPYSTYGSIGSHGCGPTSLAIAISSILQEEHDPIELTNYVCSLGGCTDNGSAYLTIYRVAGDYANKYGFKSEPTSDTEYIKQKLKEGNSIVVTITNGGFYTNSNNLISNGGHYFVLTGVDENGQVYLSDPANANNTGRTINIEELAINSNNSPSEPSFCILTR